MDVNETAMNALSLVVADARGVTVSDMTALRKLARENKVYLKVIRNTLARRAFDGTEYECVKDSLVGPSLFGFSMEDPGAAARIFKDFAKENDKFEVKVLSVGGEQLGPGDLDVLAKLPTRESVGNFGSDFNGAGNQTGSHFQRSAEQSNTCRSSSTRSKARRRVILRAA